MRNPALDLVVVMLFMCAFSSAQDTHYGNDASLNPFSAYHFAPLPLDTASVELIHFSAHRLGPFIEIAWETADEENDCRFILEKLGKTYNWEPLKRMDTLYHSNILSAYRYVDKSMDNDIYYRLVQVDGNGDSETFGPIHVGPVSDPIAPLRLYPNPATDKVLVTGTNTYPCTLEIWDMSGSRVTTITAHSSYEALDISRLNPGNYLAVDATRGQAQVIRVVR